MVKKSSMQIKRGYKANLPLLKDGQLGYCRDSKELFIGDEGKNELLNPKQTGGGGSTEGGTVTAEYLKLVSPGGREFKVSVSDSGELQVTRFITDIESAYAGLIINQVYGGGVVEDNATAITHGFIELYNTTAENILLDGLSVQYALAGDDWKVCELSGIIRPFHSYLIRANRHSENDSTSVKFVVENFDKEWPITMFNKGIKVCLVEGIDPIEVVDPFKGNDGAPIAGYIDMIGCGDTFIDGCEGMFVTGQSKQKSVRRKEGFLDTNDNEIDCEIIDYRSANIETVKPRCLADGGWDQFGPVDTTDLTEYLKINQVYGGGSDAACSHHFVELYNTHPTKPIKLNGMSLFGNTYKAPNWQHVLLEGTVPPRCSFLIRGNASNGAYKVEIANSDLNCVLKLDKAMSVFLIETTSPTYLDGIVNPHNINGAWKKVEGYIDGFGCHGNSGNMNDGSKTDMILAFEGQAPGGGDPGTTVIGCGGNSKQTSMRRINFTDTDMNSEDFEALRYANFGIDETLTNKQPRWVDYGPWDSDDIFGEEKGEAPFSIVTTFGIDPKTTRNVRWFTKEANPGVIKLGTNASNLSQEITPEKETLNGDIIHTAKVTDLTPGTTYYYKVSSGYTWSDIGSFTTESEEATEFEFVHITDTQGSNHSDISIFANGLERALEHTSPNFIVHTGDHIEDKGDTYGRWNMFFDLAKNSIMHNDFVSIPGNNDLTAVEDLTEYKQRFVKENQCPTCDTAYHFEYRNTFFMCLDSNMSLDSQSEWAKEKLLATDKKWKIVLIHAAPYTAIKETTMPLASIFEETGVHLVLCGHKHMYMRSFLMKQDAIAEDGIQYVMGNPMGVKFSNHPEQPWMEVKQAPLKSCFNNIRVTDEGITLTCNLLAEDGVQELDKFTIGSELAEIPEGDYIVTSEGDALVTSNGDNLIYN